MNTAFKLAMAAFYFWIFCIAFNGLVKAAPILQVIYQNDVPTCTQSTVEVMTTITCHRADNQEGSF